MNAENLEKAQTDYRYLCHVLRNGTASIEGLMRQMEGILKGMSAAIMDCRSEIETLTQTEKKNDSAID
jgi:hypothetical protein